MKNFSTRLFALVLLIGCTCSTYAQRNAEYEAYIANWHDLAAEQEILYGIPASITLAQALLESAAGKSELATQANNHFGIKCTNDWRGDCYSHDDENPQESFRVYRTAGQSFADHAIFLQRDRYKPCFAIPVSDYRGWAESLRKCGYASDPAYADKLCRIIEDYNLSGYEAPAPVVEAEQVAAVVVPVVAAAEQTVATVEQAPAAVENAVVEETAPVVVAAASVAAEVEDLAPETIPTARQEKNAFRRSHFRGEEQSGAHYYLAREEDTYANVAFRLNVRERDLRKWNNALGRRMHVDDHIFYSGAQSNREKRWIRKQAKLAAKAAQAEAQASGK